MAPTRNLIVVSLLLAACASAPEPEGPRIETAPDLFAALEAAGVEVVATDRLASMADLPHGRVVLVGKEPVEIYESESDAARAAAVEEILRRWPPAPAPSLWGHGRVIVLYGGQDGATLALLSGLLGDSLTLAVPAPDAPYPPAVVAAIGWLAEHEAVEAGEVRVVAFEPVEWTDTCLGLGRPDEACAAVVTPGWRIELMVDGETATLRTDDLGSQIRREG
jgi:hypothetical protein